MSNKTVPDELSFFKDKLIDSTAQTPATPGAAATGGTAPAAAKVRTLPTDPSLKDQIVVIDDSPTILTVTGGILKKFGFATIAFRDPVAALAELTEMTSIELVDIKAIICDYEMKKMNGLELMKAVRELPALQAMPFVLMTASTEKGLSQKARAANVTSFMLKPVTTNMLTNTINSVFPGRLGAAPTELKRAK